MQAKPMSKRNTPFWPDERNRDELSKIKAKVRENTDQFISISVILRRALALYAGKIGVMSADQVRQEFGRLKKYAVGRPAA